MSDLLDGWEWGSSSTTAQVSGKPTAWVRLDEIADVVGGVTKDTKKQSDPDYIEAPYLRVANVQRGYLDLGQVTTIRVPRKTLDKLRLEPGDILFNEGGDRDKLGRGWIWEGQIADCIHQNHVFRARLRGHEYDPKFVSMHGNYFGRTWFEKMGKQTTNLASLSLKTLKSFPVPKISLPEQQAIVAAIEEQFSRLDVGLASIQRAQRNIDRMRLSLLANACSGQLSTDWRDKTRPSETGSALLSNLMSERTDGTRKKPKQPISPEPDLIPDLPRTWCHASIDQICSLVTDGEHVTPPRTPDGVMLLSARNVQNGFLSFDKVDFISEATHKSLTRRLEVHPGDVLLSCSGSVGRSAVVPDGSRFSLVRSVAVLRPVRKSGRFISLMLRSPQLQAQINSRKTETAQANIFQKQIRSLTLPLPPEQEQEFIVRELESTLAMLDHLEKELNSQKSRISALQSSIFKAAFSGSLHRGAREGVAE